MKKKLNKSINFFFKNSNIENTSSTIFKNYLTSRREKYLNLKTNKRSLKSTKTFYKKNKKILDTKKLNLKKFLFEEQDNYIPNIELPRHTLDINKKKLINKKNLTIQNTKTPRNKYNFIFKNMIKNKEKKQDENYNIDNEDTLEKNEKLYFKYRRKICKSSTIDALQKRYRIYKDKFLNKYNQKIKAKISLKDINDNKYNNTSNFLTVINTNRNSDIEKQYSINVQSYKSKRIFNNNIKNIKKVHNKDSNNNIFSQDYSQKVLLDKKNINENLNLINNKEYKKSSKIFNVSNSSINQEKSKSKKNSQLFLDLPNIKKTDTQRNTNFNIGEKSINPINNLFVNNDNNLKKEIPIKKTTTINIYNNKINNINNIILNDKNIKNQYVEKENKINDNNYKNEKEENESCKSIISYDKENINNISYDNKNNKLSLSVKLKETNKNIINKQEIIYKINNNENEAKSAHLSSNDIKNIKNKSNKKKRLSILDLKPKIDLLNGLKVNKRKEIKLIKKLSVNYNSNLLKSFHLKYKGEFIDKMEKKIRKKILKTYIINNNSIIENNLQKTKKEITIKLFDELSKKILNDIEEKENNYKNKEKIMFDIKAIKSLNKKYLSKIHRKTGKLINKINIIIYTSKNQLTQIYEKNIINYSKITFDESKFLFFKYLFEYYFYYINEKIILNKDEFKCFKNCYLEDIYHANLNNESRESSRKQNKNYIFSILLQYFLMEKDKIQEYYSNERYVEKTINQINSLIKEAKTEMNDLRKTGHTKLNFIVNENEESDKIIEKKRNNEREKNTNNNFKNNNDFNKRSDVKKFTFLNLKNEFSDNDKYDSKSGYDTKSIINGEIQFKNNKKNNFDAPSKSKFSFFKKNTISHQIFHSNFSNIINNASIFNNNNNLDLSKKNFEEKYNLVMINKEKIEKKYNKLITQNIDYFFKRKKSSKNKKKEKVRESKKGLTLLKGNYMFKNLIDYRTDEIKHNIKNSIKSPIEMLFYHIKEHDFDEFVELFERKQIDINSRNSDYDSFLIYAVKCKGIKFVLYLLKKGINVNMENKLGNTALHYAFSDQNFKLADILLQHGADEFKTNILGQTPWQCLGKKNI